MKTKTPSSVSSENHELLVRLSDSVTHLGEQVTSFPAELAPGLLRIWSGWHSIEILWRKHA